MALINLNLGLQPKYKELIDDILKFIVILMTLHFLLSLSQSKSPVNFGLIDELFNADFLTLFVFGLISVYIYHMIFKQLLEIN
jgi:hypothetical protein